ncbi:hypothetical protein FRB91_007600 [Serendipita sp. 411]|nr:hypothetical protein FRB91_007600 [Serendipita sp. 411]
MQTRRLHVSGLTPAISEADLRARFSVFGNVKTVDGVGKLDGLDQPRRFAYVSLEATPDKHSKCLNILSGATWKGAKLRIGEARPDFTPRLEKERGENGHPATPRKFTRGVTGVESKNMTLVTLQNATQRGGWKVTSLHHLVRPMRMRPLHPIERPIKSTVSTIRKRRRKHVVPTRARRQKIDPTLYNATHLTEEILKAEHIFIPQAMEVESSPQRAQPSNGALHHAAGVVKTQERVSIQEDLTGTAFEIEKQKDLALLAKLFEGKVEWDGREDDLGGSDNDMRVEAPEDAHMADEVSEASSSSNEQDAGDMGQKEAVSTEETAHHEDNAARPARLKELFSIANQEPTSILAGLDLELELDNSLEFDVMPRSMQETAPANGTELHANARKQNTLHSQRRELEGFQFSTDLPYFFPLESGEVSRGAVKDTFSIAQTQGWRSVFLNPPSSDEVRKQWEAEKVALTRDWKQRYREACKRERRGGGHVDGIETIA